MMFIMVEWVDGGNTIFAGQDIVYDDRYTRIIINVKTKEEVYINNLFIKYIHKSDQPLNLATFTHKNRKPVNV